MKKAKNNELFLRPNERLNDRLTNIANEFEMDSRQEVVLSVLRDFLDGWAQYERERRARNAAFVVGLIGQLGDSENGGNGPGDGPLDSSKGGKGGQPKPPQPDKMLRRKVGREQSKKKEEAS